MRIEFITQDDPIYILPFFEEFCREYASRFEILQISACPTMGRRSRRQMVRELTALYGPAGMFRLTTEKIGAAMLGKLKRPRHAARFYSLSQLAQAYGIGYRKIDSPNAESFVAGLQERKPDVLVSVACPFILKARVLAAPRLGSVNIHHAPLPQYKGMMPTFWQMYHAEPSLGVTVHRVNDKIDEGEIVLQENAARPLNATLHELIRRAKRAGAHTMARALLQIERGGEAAQPAARMPSYFTFPTLQEIREFRRRGCRAI